jgi:uncharacterized membrane protein YdjX (TVP38/TMEM64 family)
MYVGFVYGFPEGVLFGLFGASISCLPPFVIARTVQTDTGFIGLVSKPSKKLFDSGDSARGIVAARLLPFPTDMVSYSAGLAGVSVWSFIVGTVVGLFPWVLPEILIGDSMQTFSKEGAVLTPELLVGMSLLGILVFYQFLSRSDVPE